MATSPENIIADLATNPCRGNQCIGQEQQLAHLVAELDNILDKQGSATLESVTKVFANVSEVELTQYLLSAFPVSVPAISVNCFKCYSQQKLTEMLYYLLYKLVKTKAP